MKLTIVAFLMAALAGPAWAQSQRSGSPADNPAAVLGRGWTALGAQQPARALELAEQLLRTDPGSHEALGLAIAALSAIPQPITALDAYEKWLAQVRIEDPLLLRPIAVATLEQISASNDTALAISALEHLAGAGITGARDRLQSTRNPQNALATDAALLRLGDTKAAERLIEGAGIAARGRGEAIAQVLALAGTAAVPALRRLLADPSGPTRAAAVRALGKLEAREALPEIRSRMTDVDPLVRARAAVALARMGDSQGEEQVAQMLGSPVADMRLVAAEAYADRGNGPWVASILPLLRDPAGLTRLMAAELVAPIDPESARAVLAEAAQDANPVVRAEATRILAEPSVTSLTSADWPSIRRWLRDADAVVRLHAARIVIELTSPGR